MNATRATRTRALLVVGLVAAAVAAGSAAAIPISGLQIHARLAPVAGKTAAGGFNGTLVQTGGGPAKPAVPRVPLSWRLIWTLRLPALHGPATASLRVGAQGGAASAVRALCTRCTVTAKGRVTLPAGQALRIAGGRAVVVVRARSVTLRGPVKVVRVHSGPPTG